MPTGFGPLSDDDIRPDIDRAERVIQGMHLADHRYAGFLDASGIRTWIREGQHHRTRMPLQRDVEQSRILGNGPGDKPGSDVGSRDLCRFGFEPDTVDVTATQQPEPSSRGYR